mgnify:CR=1 FL=1
MKYETISSRWSFSGWILIVFEERVGERVDMGGRGWEDVWFDIYLNRL